jgi:hypothetical protein
MSIQKDLAMNMSYAFSNEESECIKSYTEGVLSKLSY